MGRPREVFTEEEKKERRRLYNKRYKQTEKGRNKTREAVNKYQKSKKSIKNKVKYKPMFSEI